MTPAEIQAKRKQAQQIAQPKVIGAIALTSSLASNIEQHLPDVSFDPAFLEVASNRLTEVIDQLRAINYAISQKRFELTQGPLPAEFFNQEAPKKE